MKYTYAILGGTGHIGAVLCKELLRANQSVLVVGHSTEMQQHWIDQGAGFEITDVLDSDKLHEIFAKASRLFILNPPADPAKDADKLELKYIESINRALEGLKLEKIVMASTYGAQNGTDIFDLGTLFELEQALQQQGSPLAIIRSAYYMSNFDLPAQMAIESGKLSTVLPAHFKLPMVAPADIAQFAAKLLQDNRIGTFYIQAEEEYSANDAAAILTSTLNKTVRTNEIPESHWANYMQTNGFSKPSAESFVGMTKLTLAKKFEAPSPHIGPTTLEQYLKQVVESASKTKNDH